MCGATAYAFESAHVAEAWLRTRGGDVVVSDLEVGGGVEPLLRSAKALGVPCLVVTGHVAPERLDAALRAGFDDYRIKPVEPTELCGAVEKLLDRKRQADALP